MRSKKKFWVGTFEVTDEGGYALARHIFGLEPSDPEIYEFVLDHYHEIKFGHAKKIHIEIQRMNPKRMQREVRREMGKIKEVTQPSTRAQDYLREEMEKKKKEKEKKSLSSAEKETRKHEQFALKQEKRKEKHRGH